MSCFISDSSVIQGKDKKPGATADEAMKTLKNIHSSSLFNKQNEEILMAAAPLRKYDVLTGRGSGPNRSQGNTLFRQMVGETYQEYLQSLGPKGEAIPVGHPHHRYVGPAIVFQRSMGGTFKNLLARQILIKVQGQGGRFLRRISMEEYRTLRQDQKARIVRVPVDPRAVIKAQSSNETEFQEDGRSSISQHQRDDLYAELSVKETLEKIKQSLRFQVDRQERQQQGRLQVCPSGQPIKRHSSLQASHLFLQDGNVRKRKAMNAALLGSPQLPRKKPAVHVDALVMTANAKGVFQNPPVHAASCMKILSADSTKKLQEKTIARQDPSSTSLITNHGTGDFSMWPPSRIPEAGRLRRISSHCRLRCGNLPKNASVPLERLQERQNQQLQVKERWKFPAAGSTLADFQGYAFPTSSPPTPSALHTTYVEALSRLLVHEQLNAALASTIRHKMATLLLEQCQNGNARVSGLISNESTSLQQFNPSTPATRVLLYASLEASRRQSLPLESTGIALNALNQRAKQSSGGVNEDILGLLCQRVGAPADGAAMSSINSLIAHRSNRIDGPTT
jgi:hypothetical protein